MIAVDVMGCDHGPGVVIRGAVNAAKVIPVVLFGPEELIISELRKIDPDWQINHKIFIYNALQCIEMDEDPVAAVRNKKQSSMAYALQHVKNGQCLAAVSAGNSGAFMVASLFELGRCKNVERPAIASFLPTEKGQVLALDLGANTECRAEYLLQFAQIGCEYLQAKMKLSNPRIGLLSNGREDSKGSKLTKEAFALIKQSSLNFIGNVEPSHVFKHVVDVVVCDGFSGNVLLKTSEAVRSMMINFFKQSQDTDLVSKRALCDNGGAILLGVNGNVILCHGSADSNAIENAIKFAWSVTNSQ